MPVLVRNLNGIRVTPRRRSVHTSGPPVGATGGPGSGSDRRQIRAGEALELPGQVRHLASSRVPRPRAASRARPRLGDALVAVMKPADLGNGMDAAV